jgi:predicted GTPase
MDIKNIRPPIIKKEKDGPKTDMNIVNQLLNDIVLYNDVENDFPNVPFWDREKELLKSLETDARDLLEKAVMVSGSHQTVRVAVVGNFSAGKSTFINSLIQDDICPVADKSTTSSVTTFTFAHQKAFSLIDKTGVKKEISFEEYNKMIQHGTETTTDGNSHFFVEGPWSFVRDISLLDTPGFERGEDAFTENIGGDDAVTEEVIKKDADVLFWVMDINTGTITKDQKERIERLKRETNNAISIYVVLNKSDYKTSNSRQNILEGIKNEIGHLIKDVILYSSKKQDENQLTLHKILSRIKTSVNKQSLSYQENWEIKFSSSIRGRGGLKFNYNDNGSESNFIYEDESYTKTGRVSTRIEVQEILKKIGTKNREFSYQNFEIELAEYNKRKQNLNYISAKVEKRMDALFDNFYEYNNNLFRDILSNINVSFIEKNIGAFKYLDFDKDFDEIVDSFMNLYSMTFSVFTKEVEENFTNYSLDEKELEWFDIRCLFVNCLLAQEKDIKQAIENTLGFFSDYIFNGYSSKNYQAYCSLYDTYNSIYQKLP